MFRRLPAVLLSLALAACGFQLRGDVSLPAAMESTYIVTQGMDARLLRTVARALTLSGAGIARHPEQASAILSMPGSSVQRRVLARDAQGQPREYEIAAVLRYTVRTADGGVIVPLQQVEQYGNVVLDPSEPLANAGEVERAVAALREQAVWDMLERIAASAKPVPVNGSDAGAPGNDPAGPEPIE